MADFQLLKEFFGAISSVYSYTQTLLGPLPATAIFFIIGIYIFALFYNIFFERISKREIFKIELKAINLEYSYTDMSFGQIFRFFVKNIIFFPILALLITIFTTIFLILMSKDQPVETIASISVAVVMVVRILAYTNEKLAIEVAKVLPFALLAAILSNPTTFASSDLLNRGNQLIASASSLVPLFFTFIAIELILQPLVQIQRLAKEASPLKMEQNDDNEKDDSQSGKKQSSTDQQ